MKHTYETHGTCSVKIDFELDGNIVRDISFEKGCNGNLQAVSRLADGMTVDEIEKKCKGIICVSKGVNRGTSCADQLAIAILNAYKEERGE